MMKIKCIEAFEGIVENKRRKFSAGEEVTDLSPELAALYVAKGHAEEIPAGKPAKGDK